MKLTSRPVVVFLIVFCAAMAFAVFTRHAWEDYWITFRSSRNFAEGHGLVFNRGDRLHTFTSPLGVLLPALAYLLTFNSSDYGALWIFRLMSAAALAGGAVLLFATARRMQYGALAAVALIAFVACDAKILDFSTNGMETGLLLLFLAWTLYALVARSDRGWLHLGLAWGGLMWTRPDSFIYIGALSFAAWLFNDPRQTGRTRGEWLKLFVQAGLVTTAVYLPWLIAAQLYYGTPIPHTITAKGLSNPDVSLTRFLKFLRELPATLKAGRLSIDGTFLPSYYMAGGWPSAAVLLGRTVALIVALVWCVPVVRWEGRVASFAFFVGHFYLSFFPYFPFPWYLPATTLLAFVVLASLVQQGTDLAARRGWNGFLANGMRWSLLAAVGAFVALSLFLTTGAARQLKAAQRWVEDGNRKQIGLYLREHAASGDTVFMEPLGYIGYFSGLKTYDFPGLSSREMVAARKQVGSEWAALINYLQPSWLVLRDPELRLLGFSDSGILYRYQQEREFDVRDAVKNAAIPGRNYLETDSHFTLFHRISPPWVSTPFGKVTGIFPGGTEKRLYDTDMLIVHAAGELVVDVPPEAHEVTVSFGFDPDAYTGEREKTDGARFSIHVNAGQGDLQIWTRQLSPATVPADRGLQSVTVSWGFLKGPQPTKLILRTVPGETITRDWTAWSRPVFR
jgi:hypothetical protein